MATVGEVVMYVDPSMEDRVKGWDPARPALIVAVHPGVEGESFPTLALQVVDWGDRRTHPVEVTTPGPEKGQMVACQKTFTDPRVRHMTLKAPDTPHWVELPPEAARLT